MTMKAKKEKKIMVEHLWESGNSGAMTQAFVFLVLLNFLRIFFIVRWHKKNGLFSVVEMWARLWQASNEA